MKMLNEAVTGSIDMSSSLYATDFYTWVLEQVKLLKKGDFQQLADVI